MIRTVLLNTGSSPNLDKYSLFTDGPYNELIQQLATYWF